MIKVKIVNDFDRCLEVYGEKELREDAEFDNGYATNPFYLKPYDKEKFKDVRVVEFETLKEIEAFRKDAANNIEYTDEHKNSFSNWDWDSIFVQVHIDDSEDNTMILEITAEDEWRD